jgi:hypothetical protein
MSLSVAETRQILPYPYESVFDGLIAVLGPAGFLVKHHDRTLGHISAAAGMSAFSWGENVVLQVLRREDATTELMVQSSLKVRFNLTATGRNAQNAERILATLSHYLRGGTRDVAAAVAAAPAASSPALPYVMTIVIAVIVFASMLLI